MKVKGKTLNGLEKLGEQKCLTYKQILNQYNANASWYANTENICNDEVEQPVHQRKILLPEEDTDFECESDTDYSGDEDESIIVKGRNSIINFKSLCHLIEENLVFKTCNKK